MAKTRKTRLQFNDNEWREILAALTVAIVHAGKSKGLNKEFEFMLRSNMKGWQNLSKQIQQRLLSSEE